MYNALIVSKVGFSHEVRFATLADAKAFCLAYTKAESCRTAKVYTDSNVEVFDAVFDPAG